MESFDIISTLSDAERKALSICGISKGEQLLRCDTAALCRDARRAREFFPEDMAALPEERLLAITKCDMLDDELIEQMRPTLPEGIPSVFISSVANMNITRLKDMLWDALQK